MMQKNCDSPPRFDREYAAREKAGSKPVGDVLAIVGSPRKQGNTHLLVREVLAGAEAAGAETELVFLGDLTIRQCDGCLACWQGNPCVKDDDMNDLYSRIAACDVLVLGTPVYWYGPTALMKAFIDRFVYFNCAENRLLVRNKSAAIVIPYEETAEETAAPVIDFFRRSLDYLEMRLAGQLIAPGLSRRGEVAKDNGRMGQAYQLGQQLIGTR